MFSQDNGVQKCDGWNPNSCRSLVLSQSQDEVSSGLSNVSGLEVTAFDFVYCSLSLLRVFAPVCLCPHLLFYVQHGCCKVKGYVR